MSAGSFRKQIIGRNIKMRRKAAGLSQTELGALMSVSQRHVSDWERGIHEPSEEHLCEIAEHLGAHWSSFYLEHGGVVA